MINVSPKHPCLYAVFQQYGFQCHTFDLLAGDTCVALATCAAAAENLRNVLDEADSDDSAASAKAETLFTLSWFPLVLDEDTSDGTDIQDKLLDKLESLVSSATGAVGMSVWAKAVVAATEQVLASKSSSGDMLVSIEGGESTPEPTLSASDAMALHGFRFGIFADPDIAGPDTACGQIGYIGIAIKQDESVTDLECEFYNVGPNMEQPVAFRLFDLPWFPIVRGKNTVDVVLALEAKIAEYMFHENMQEWVHAVELTAECVTSGVADILFKKDMTRFADFREMNSYWKNNRGELT